LYTSTNLEIDAINKFILYNMEATRPWVTLYEEKRRKWDSDRKAFRWLNGRSMPYPDHLKENMPKICPNSWVADQIQEKYVVSSHNPHGEDLDALNIGIRCNNSVITSLSTTFYL
jgi:hypothetical protein